MRSLIILIIVLVAVSSCRFTSPIGLLTWVPEGADQEKALRGNCSAKALSDRLLSESNSPQIQTQIIKSFFTICGPMLSANTFSDLWSLILMEHMEYDRTEHPDIQELKISLETGEKVSAVLGIKPGSQPRPLVIIKCGFLCNSRKSIPFTIMHMFDEGPYHVLFLGNSSGSEHVLQNQFLSFGGFYEGLQFIRVAKYLQSTQFVWHNKISSMHIVAVSLGAHGALYASAYDHARKKQGLPLLFKSITAMCPVVDLEKTMNSNFNSIVQSRIVEYKLWQTLDVIKHSWPDFKDVLGMGEHQPLLTELPHHLAKASAQYLSQQEPDFFLPPFDNVQIKNEKDFWQANDFTSLPSKASVPVYVLAADNDPVVPTPLNAARLKKDSIYPVYTPRGSHCAFSMVYGWRQTGALLRSLVLSNSPELLATKRRGTQILSLNDSVNSSQIQTQRWVRRPGESQYQLNLSHAIYDHSWYNLNCWWQKLWSGECRIQSSHSVTIPNLPSYLSRSAKNKTEAQAQQRWANANITIQPISQSRVEISWDMYE